MRKGIWASDFHLGLQTDDMDRTDEIMEIIRFIFNHAVSVKADFVVLGGDIFHNNTPSEGLIALFISALNILKGIRVFVMVGNHDSIAGHKRRSCLSFVKELEGYPNVKLVDDIKTVRMFKGGAEVGDVYFTFLPFMAKAHLKPAYKSVQQYVDVQAKKIQKKMKQYAQHYVFSHFMPPDCISGTEEGMLKKVDVMVPKAFMAWKMGQCKPPIIINGHVHTRQKVENIEVVGSQFFTAFGEKEKEKFFLQLDIPEYIGEGPGSLKFIETPCKKLKEIDLEFHQLPSTEGVIDVIEGGLQRLDWKNTILKLNVTLTEGAVGFDSYAVREALSAKAYYVKPIYPRILRKRVKRNRKQTVQLSPHDGVKEWLKRHKPKNPKRLLKMADEYIEGVL